MGACPGLWFYSPVVRMGDAGSGHVGNGLANWGLVMGSLVGPMTREGWGVVGEGLIS